MTQTIRKTVLATAITVGAFLALAGVAHAQSRELFNNTNVYAVNNGIGGQPTFSVASPTMITEISTYHWNFGRGMQPGALSLRSLSGQSWGPFAARGSAGQNNAQNVNWTATTSVVVPAGTYMVFDSNPATWSSNAQSGGRGFTHVYGYAVAASAGGGSGSGSGGGSGSGSGGSAYGFTPCAANSNPVAVVGPCVVPVGGLLNVFEVRAGITPYRIQLLANGPYSTGVNLIATLTPAGGSRYTVTITRREFCQAAGAQLTYNVFLIDTLNRRQGQIGTFTPDCR